jgi:hypothetical protein
MKKIKILLLITILTITSCEDTAETVGCGCEQITTLTDKPFLDLTSEDVIYRLYIIPTEFCEEEILYTDITLYEDKLYNKTVYIECGTFYNSIIN